MKKITIFIFCLMALYTQAQNTFPTTGNVGVGTSSPISFGVGSNPQILQVHKSGATTAGGLLQLSTDQTATNTGVGIVSFGSTGLSNADKRIAEIVAFKTNASTTSGTGDLSFATWNSGIYGEKMRILANGNIGIGTANPIQKLSVNGTIQAKEIVVNTGWSDFVFDNNYKLRSLTKVEQFVKTNKHLPEIPSQQQVEKNGVQLGDISSKLLMKIEELTLYMIKMKKENEFQQKEIEEQKALIKILMHKTEKFKINK